MSWTFIGMLLLVVGLIAANLALLKHGSKNNQRPLARAKQKQNAAQPQKMQATASTAPAVAHDNDKNATASPQTNAPDASSPSDDSQNS